MTFDTSATPFLAVPLCCALLLAVPGGLRGQGTDSGSGLDDFRGMMAMTTKGISTIPNLTLGKPAAAFHMVALKNGLSFEPEFRISLEGQPWSFIFRWRYDLIESERFGLTVGAHPAINFRPFYTLQDGVEREINEARRFVAGELLSSYSLAPGVSLDGYFLFSHGLEASLPDYVSFLNVGLGLPGIEGARGVALGFRPQLYYLDIDGSGGVYGTLNATLSKRDLPFAITSIATAPIQTRIAGSPDLLWNVSLVYSFDLID